MLLHIDYMDFVRPLSAILFCLVARNISDIEISRGKFLLWTLIIYTSVAITTMISEIAGSVVILVLLVAMLRSGGLKIASSLMTALFTMIIMIICNMFSGLIINNIYINIDYYAVVPNDFSMFMTLLAFNYIFTHILSRALGMVMNKRIKIKSVGKINPKTEALFFSITTLVFLFVYITALSRKMQLNPSLLLLYVIFLMFLIIFTYFIFISTTKENKLRKRERELEQLEKYTGNIETMYNDIRSLRHDYSNVLSSMMGYMEDDDMEGLKEYFDTKVVPFYNRMENADTNIGVLSGIKNPSLKGIIALKLIHAQEEKISVVVDIKEDVQINSIDILDLNRVVGILLDNAYEAAIESENPYINLGIIKNEDDITLVIVNSIKEGNISINKIFARGYSSKGENRGYGLSNVSEILKKYNSVAIDTEIEDGEFRQALHIVEGEGM